MPAFFDQILQDNGININTSQTEEILDEETQDAELPEDAPNLGIQRDEIAGVGIERDASAGVGIPEDEVTEGIQEGEDVPEEDAIDTPSGEKKSSKMAGFENVISKIGLVVAGLSAVKGNTKPLEMLLAMKIGKNKALQIAKQNREAEAEKKRKNQLELGKFQLDVAEFQRKSAQDRSNALKLNQYQIKVVEGVPYVWKPNDPFSMRKVEGFDKKKKWIHTDGFWWEQKQDGTYIPIKATKGREVNFNGEYITENKVVDGETVTTTELSDIGRARKNQIARNLMKDDIDYGMKALDMNYVLSTAQEREDSIRTVASAIENAKRTGRLTAAQVATLNQFIRNVDEGATVRENDIALVESGQSLADKLESLIARAGQQDLVVNPALVEDMANMLFSLTEVRRNMRRDVFEAELSALKNDGGDLVLSDNSLRIIRNRGESMYFGSQAEFDKEFLMSKKDTPEVIRMVDNAFLDGDKETLSQLVRGGSVYAIRKFKQLSNRINATTN